MNLMLIFFFSVYWKLSELSGCVLCVSLLFHVSTETCGWLCILSDFCWKDMKDISWVTSQRQNL